MILENGTLQTKIKTGGGTIKGVPITVNEVLGKIFPCNIKSKKYTSNADGGGPAEMGGTQAVDSAFVRASYEVLVETDNFTAEKVVLKDNRGNTLGEFRVLEVQYLDYVNVVKITL